PLVPPHPPSLHSFPTRRSSDLTGIFPRSHRTHRGTSKGFDRVAAQKFVPVVIEQVAGGKDVAPSDFAAVPDNHADNALTLETGRDRKSTRLNSSHRTISYAVFC